MQLYKRFLSFGLMLFCLYSSHTFAQQNLVPNFSFEIYDTCPYLEDQIEFAIGWSKYSNANSTPDYYNACAPVNGFGVPKNITGYQSAHRFCSAYAGIVTYAVSPMNYREHIGVKLIQPLLIGQKYFISFYSVMSEVLIGGTYFGIATNNIGARLSTVSYSGNSPCPIDNWAHLNYSQILNDSINWTHISVSFVADSAYEYLTIGNFFDDANTDTLNYKCGTCLRFFGYYYIDDICVSTDSILCNGGINLIPCNTSVNKDDFNTLVNIFPNPTFDFITIELPFKIDAEIILYDVLGKILLKSEIKNDYHINLNISSFSNGYYFLSILNNNENKLIKKIIKL